MHPSTRTNTGVGTTDATSTTITSPCPGAHRMPRTGAPIGPPLYRRNHALTPSANTRRSAPVDLVSPEEAGAALCLSADQLLDAVNRDLLPAYDLGGVIRFRAADVASVAALLVDDRIRQEA